ncbi:hypothetical protein BU23DRAFT_228510 [Bimuria novae-zelandiae CBS 107.79]|uniref:Uncharacterized protein n=1 Tax=Bimuria novae-zelandiae CBS 107.79 TaxID=1447943 RepID=A0A6A5VNT9_9PLEO|nr:hypothetical protein BU23DRAFT_228510 [Bimuria novae-zelandiae CBS 107.79]
MLRRSKIYGDRNQSPSPLSFPSLSFASKIFTRRVCLLFPSWTAAILLFRRLGVSCAMQSKSNIHRLVELSPVSSSCTKRIDKCH